MTPSVAVDSSARRWVLQLPDVLPADFGLPEPVYWVPTLLVFLAAAVALYALGPTVTDWTAPALVPWIGVGAVLHVLYQGPSLSPAVRPLFGNPTVYFTTGAALVLVWTVSELVADARSPGASNDRQLGVVGGGVLLVLLGWSAYLVEVTRQAVQVRPFWPAVALVVGVALAGLCWAVMSLLVPRTVVVAGRTGAVVLAGHALDGVSTALAVDGPVDGFTERTPLSRLLIDVGASLPTADLVGTAWLFVLVKVVLAGVVLVAFRETVEDRPDAARVVLALVAAVGLGPAVHNLVLFAVGGWVRAAPDPTLLRAGVDTAAALAGL